MRQYILKRLLMMPITLIGITFLVFFLTRMVPGGPVERMLQEQAIGALSGDKVVGQTHARLGNADMERLEELFAQTREDELLLLNMLNQLNH